MLWKTVFPWTGWGGGGSGGNVGDGEQWGAAREASLARPPLTSHCEAQVLTGLRPILVRGPGVGDPCSIGHFYKPSPCWLLRDNTCIPHFLPTLVQVTTFFVKAEILFRFLSVSKKTGTNVGLP